MNLRIIGVTAGTFYLVYVVVWNPALTPRNEPLAALSPLDR